MTWGGRLLLALALWATGAAGAAGAATLSVGPGQAYALPHQAIAAAHDGDTVTIAPGVYRDCAIVRRNRLTIEGTGPGVVLAGRSCAGKGILIIDANDVTVKALTLQGARVPDGNGSGIRAEGGDLTVKHVRFVDNEDGILAAPNPRAVLLVLDSQFVGNGSCANAGGCAHALYAGAIAVLDVERSRFRDTREGHSIKSRAARTVVKDCTIADGAEGTSSYQIDVPNGGDVLIEGNRLEKGPKSQNRRNAIMIGEEGVTHPTKSLVVKDNTLVNDTGWPTVFVHNETATPAVLAGNAFKGGMVVALMGPGTVR